MEPELRLQWYPQEGVLRKWLRLRTEQATTPLVIEEITLGTLAAEQLCGEFRPGLPQSYPLFLDGYFAGIEFPVAATRVENGKAYLGHRPLCKLEPDRWYESRRAVYGTAPAGGEVLAFHRYIESTSTAPEGTAFQLQLLVDIARSFQRRRHCADEGVRRQSVPQARRGVGLVTIAWDGRPNGVWDINRRLFPDEFAKIQAGAAAMGGRLGLWTSPSSCYPQAVDPQWALDHGYENGGAKMLSLAGEKYRTKYGPPSPTMWLALASHRSSWTGCHSGAQILAGSWPSEAVAQGAMDAFEPMRAANSEVWLEATYGAYASPWWVFQVNSVIGSFGDDSPHGRVPCPAYRESYTTARDYYNLQGEDRLPSPIPRSGKSLG